MKRKYQRKIKAHRENISGGVSGSGGVAASRKRQIIIWRNMMYQQWRNGISTAYGVALASSIWRKASAAASIMAAAAAAYGEA